MRFMSKRNIVIFIGTALLIVGIFFLSGGRTSSDGRNSFGKASVKPEAEEASGTAFSPADLAPEPNYYARVVEGEVTNVIVAEPDFIADFKDDSPGEWIQTWHNLSGGVHYDPNTGQPDDKEARRKNTAGIGYSYDKNLDAFIPPKPFNSWKLNEETALWEAPVARPDDEGKKYGWNEDEQAWREVTLPEMPVAESSDSKE